MTKLNKKHSGKYYRDGISWREACRRWDKDEDALS